MDMIKKYAACTLAAVMLCSVPSAVGAEQLTAGPIAVNYDKSTLASADDRVTIEFSLPADTSANGAEVRISYPEDKILVGEVEAGTLYSGAYISSYEDEPGEFKAFALNDTTFEGGGDVITVTLRAAEGASSGTAEIKITTLYTTVDLGNGTNEYNISISLPQNAETEEGVSDEPSETLSPSHAPVSGGGHGTINNSTEDEPSASETAAPSDVQTPAPSSEPEDTPEFTDIAGHWAEESIIELAGRGLINGFDDNTFRPEAPVTRAQFTKMLVDLDGLNMNTSVRIFEDVPTDSWYAPCVTAAYAAGIVQGDGTYFRPDSSITREEMAVMAARCLDMTASAQVDFSDSGSVSDWARDAVNALAAAGVINGFEDGTFRPGGISTRAEAAVILERLDRIGG